MPPALAANPPATRDHTEWLKQQREKHQNAYQPWLPKDDEMLSARYKEGVGVKELVTIFSRNAGAIRSRLKKLRLIQ